MNMKANEKTISKDYWANLANRITEPQQTRNKRGDYSDLEIEFLRPYLKPDLSVLDLGSGTGLVVNKLVELVGHITAVEKFQNFSQYIQQSKKLELINADIIGFRLYKQFDLVLATGVIQCLEGRFIQDLYQNIFNMTKPGGHFIAHIHCGIKEDVIVDQFSEELDTNYYAEYRYHENEKQRILDSGFKTVELHDIFPDWLNKWPNTRHFLFVCTKAKSEG